MTEQKSSRVKLGRQGSGLRRNPGPPLIRPQNMANDMENNLSDDTVSLNNGNEEEVVGVVGGVAQRHLRNARGRIAHNLNRTLSGFCTRQNKYEVKILVF
jgi:hypothetical protein